MKLIPFFALLSLMLMSVACRPEAIPPRLNLTAGTHIEGNAPITEVFITFSLSETTTEAVNISFSTEDVSAEAGLDYVAIVNRTVTIAPGQQEVKSAIQLIDDGYREANESFNLILNSVENAELLFDKGVITITDDDYKLDIPDEGYSTPTSYSGYTLAWADEFDGESLNLDNWSYILGDGGFGNNELQTYTKERENLYLTDDCMVIEAQKWGESYKSARIRSLGKQEFKYGRIDIRAKMPIGQGIWPALWMMGNDSESTGWPGCGEIDIMEYLGHDPNITHGTVHYGVDWTQHKFKGQSYTLPNGSFDENFYVFTIIWEENSIEWYVDDIYFFGITSSDIGNETWRFDHPFYFLVNMAVGGDWPGSPDSSTKFPQRMFVDYIRVFQQ